MIFILMYVPYGAPAHDVDILGVYESEEMAYKAKYALEDEYDLAELIIEEKELINA